MRTSLYIDEFKHLAAICKLTVKDSAELSSLHVIIRNRNMYICALNGHTMSIWKRDADELGDCEAWFSLPYIQINILLSMKEKLVFFDVLDATTCKVTAGAYSCDATEVTERNFVWSILERIEGTIRDGELLPSPALWILRSNTLAHAFPYKGAAINLLQAKGCPNDLQIAICETWPDYLGIIMPIQPSTEEHAANIANIAMRYFDN